MVRVGGEELDLSAFYAAYRQDGHGRAAHDPAMMVALLLYAYALGRRSSRAIERACVEDVAFRVIAANQVPDHCTIARLMKDGRRFGRPPDPYQPPDTPTGKVNVTDPDSQLVKATRGWIQGYNAQAAVNEQQIVIAAEVTVDSPDFGHLEPMVDAAERELEQIGVSERPEVVVADAGYWHQAQMEKIVCRRSRC